MRRMALRSSRALQKEEIAQTLAAELLSRVPEPEAPITHEPQIDSGRKAEYLAAPMRSRMQAT